MFTQLPLLLIHFYTFRQSSSLPWFLSQASLFLSLNTDYFQNLCFCLSLLVISVTSWWFLVYNSCPNWPLTAVLPSYCLYGVLPFTLCQYCRPTNSHPIFHTGNTKVVRDISYHLVQPIFIRPLRLELCPWFQHFSPFLMLLLYMCLQFPT